jgi:hypothetical protein
MISLFALLLGGIIYIQITYHKNDFYKTVKESLKTSEGYDQKLITLVNHLEEVLAIRASFGYKGKKDPMTGKKRKVVLSQKPGFKHKKNISKPQIQPETKIHVDTRQEIDPVKLTAIIYDNDSNKFSAIVMDGERSFSVETGDIIHGRKITVITNEMIRMENINSIYTYDVFGSKKKVLKNSQSKVN